MNTEKSHSEEQAAAQVASILELVRALDRTTAAEDFAARLEPAKCRQLLQAAELTVEDDASADDLREAVAEALNNDTIDADAAGFEWDEDEARQRIQEDALSVQLRSGWVGIGDEMKAEEFEILLCTGGPAVRILGELLDNEPRRAWIEHQDWGTPWTHYVTAGKENESVLTYCRQFWFGE